MTFRAAPVRRFLLLSALVVVAGCAAARPPGGKYSEADYDPWEPFNRNVTVFNDRLDRWALRPLAVGYRKVTPKVARGGISNFFNNLGYPVVFINDFLQGKVAQGGRDVLRFGLNSTLGVGGIFDFASRVGLEQNNEDFGQTLAVWGVPSGRYLVLPFFGPATLRDGPALSAGFLLDGRNFVGDTGLQDKLLILDVINGRSNLISAEGLLADSFDPYITLREAWLQRREFLIHDGDPPQAEDEFLDEFLDEEDELEE
ncbi:MAG: VacJ family lipoprotein [Pseudomonadota bacterium]